MIPSKELDECCGRFKPAEMSSLCASHTVAAAIEKTGAYLQHGFTTEAKIREALGAKPGRRTTIWSLWFAFCIPLMRFPEGSSASCMPLPAG